MHLARYGNVVIGYLAVTWRLLVGVYFARFPVLLLFSFSFPACHLLRRLYCLLSPTGRVLPVQTYVPDYIGFSFSSSSLPSSLPCAGRVLIASSVSDYIRLSFPLSCPALLPLASCRLCLAYGPRCLTIPISCLSRTPPSRRRRTSRNDPHTRRHSVRRRMRSDPFLCSYTPSPSPPQTSSSSTLLSPFFARTS